MIAITGMDDHDQPEWMIRISGIRTCGPIPTAQTGWVAFLSP